MFPGKKFGLQVCTNYHNMHDQYIFHLCLQTFLELANRYAILFATIQSAVIEPVSDQLP